MPLAASIVVVPLIGGAEASALRQAIETGRFQRAEDAVREALSLWEERERKRAEILAAVDTAEDSLARGEGRGVTQQSMRQLADEVKQRGRLRLDADQVSEAQHR